MNNCPLAAPGPHGPATGKSRHKHTSAVGRGGPTPGTVKQDQDRMGDADSPASLPGQQGLWGPNQSQEQQQPQEAAPCCRGEGFPAGRKTVCVTVERAPARKIWV